MLRNSFKGSYCCLVVFCLSACSSTGVLFSNNSKNDDLRNVVIKADPTVEFQFRNVLTQELPYYANDYYNYNITINIAKESQTISSMAMVSSEMQKFKAQISVYDKTFNLIGETTIDSWDTYTSDDENPFTAITSERSSQQLVIEDLAHSTVFEIRRIITSVHL